MSETIIFDTFKLDEPTNISGRIYPTEEVQKAIIKTQLSHKKMYVTFNDEATMDGSINLANITHAVNRIFVEDGYLKIEAKVIDTPAYLIYKGLVDEGCYYKVYPVCTGIVNEDKTVKDIEILNFTFIPLEFTKPVTI